MKRGPKKEIIQILKRVVPGWPEVLEIKLGEETWIFSDDKTGFFIDYGYHPKLSGPGCSWKSYIDSSPPFVSGMPLDNREVQKKILRVLQDYEKNETKIITGSI